MTLIQQEQAMRDLAPHGDDAHRPEFVPEERYVVLIEVHDNWQPEWDSRAHLTYESAHEELVLARSAGYNAVLGRIAVMFDSRDGRPV